MAQPTYKITDMDALEKACPKAVETIKTINRTKLTRLFNAARDMGMSIPGVEEVDTTAIDAAVKPGTTETKSFIAEFDKKRTEKKA